MKKVFTVILASIIVVAVVVFLAITLAFNSNDHSQYDLPKHTTTGTRTSESSEHQAVARLVTAGMAKPPNLGRKELMQLMRKQMDDRGEAFKISSEIRPVDAGGVSAEYPYWSSPHFGPFPTVTQQRICHNYELAHNRCNRKFLAFPFSN